MADHPPRVSRDIVLKLVQVCLHHFASLLFLFLTLVQQHCGTLSCAFRTPEPRCLLLLVQEHCRRTRRLQPHEQQLFWDVLLVLRGGRPAFLLDYAAAVPTAALENLVRDLHRDTGVQCERGTCDTVGQERCKTVEYCSTVFP